MKAPIIIASVAALALAGCGRKEKAANEMAANEMMMNEAVTENVMATNAMMENGMMANNMAAAMPTTGQEYAAMASAGDRYEIESSDMAATKATNADVKAFAKTVAADHRKATADLKTAAAKVQPAVMVSPMLNAEQQGNIDALRKATGAAFDRMYLEQQVAAHEKTLAMLRGYAQSSDVPALKDHAAATATVVEKHLARAKELMAAMK